MATESCVKYKKDGEQHGKNNVPSGLSDDAFPAVLHGCDGISDHSQVATGQVVGIWRKAAVFVRVGTGFLR